MNCENFSLPKFFVCPVSLGISLSVRLTLVGEKKKIEYFVEFLMQNLFLRFYPLSESLASAVPL